MYAQMHSFITKQNIFFCKYLSKVKRIFIRLPKSVSLEGICISKFKFLYSYIIQDNRDNYPAENGLLLPWIILNPNTPFPQLKRCKALRYSIAIYMTWNLISYIPWDHNSGALKLRPPFNVHTGKSSFFPFLRTTAS